MVLVTGVDRKELDMPKKRSANFNKLQDCIRNKVKNWNKTTLTDIEKYCTEMYIIWGIIDAALYILPLDDYQALKDWVLEEYGYNVGGAFKKDEKGANK